MQVAMLGVLEVRAGSGELLEDTDALAACSHVRILATSREPLAITGEALWTVGPLTLPPDPAVTSDQAERAGLPAPAIDDYASVRLLTQRARAVVPGFEVTLAERALWRRFSRFAGGATLEAAERVCAGPAAEDGALPAGQVLDLRTSWPGWGSDGARPWLSAGWAGTARSAARPAAGSRCR